MRRKLSRYGWIPDVPDVRDQYFRAPRRVGALPPSVDLRGACPAVYDQGELGSCTANAVSAALEFDQLKQKLSNPFTPSRLFIYYNERAIEGTIDADSGAMLRDGIKTVAGQGACPETMWPYVEDKFTNRPPTPCYKFAKAHPAVQYSRVAQDVGQMKACLAAGYPFVIGLIFWRPRWAASFPLSLILDGRRDPSFLANTRSFDAFDGLSTFGSTPVYGVGSPFEKEWLQDERENHEQCNTTWKHVPLGRLTAVLEVHFPKSILIVLKHTPVCE